MFVFQSTWGLPFNLTAKREPGRCKERTKQRKNLQAVLQTREEMKDSAGSQETRQFKKSSTVCPGPLTGEGPPDPSESRDYVQRLGHELLLVLLNC